MKTIKSTILLLAALLLPLSLMAEEGGHGGKEEGINIPEIVLEHLADSYEWHITTIDGKHVSIPLPVIVRSENTGEWIVCCSTAIEEATHEGKDYKGLFFNEERHGKIYEKMPDGTEVRPLDLSITKSVLQIWIVVAVMLGVFLTCARWYKKRDKTSEAPGGFVGCVEMLVMTIHDDLIKSCIGKHYKPYANYLLTVFFFIFTTNMIGLIPLFPGGANVTGNINVTMLLALCTMLAINIFANRHYWKEILWPEVPGPLKLLMIPIEIFGVFTKPFALMIRLFANMMAGHAVILSFTCVIFLGWSLGVAYGVGLNLFSAIMLLFMNCLEVLVAFVQAYVFTLLSAVFIGLSRVEHHAE